jgi:hypothetical protein
VTQISGTNLLTTSSVRINGKVVETFVIFSNTLVLAQIPDGSTTGPISLTTAGGQAISSDIFTVLAPPDIDFISPSRGPVGTVVTLRGTGLSGVTGVSFGNVAATTFAASSATLATATVPAGTLTAQVTLTNAIASAVSAQVFTLTAPRPGGVGWVPTEPMQLLPYPNPVGNAQRLTVQVLNRRAVLGSTDVYLVDALGRRVAVAPLDVAKSEAVFNLDGLAGGMYIVRCGAVAEQVLIQR